MTVGDRVWCDLGDRPVAGFTGALPPLLPGTIARALGEFAGVPIVLVDVQLPSGLVVAVPFGLASLRPRHEGAPA